MEDQKHNQSPSEMFEQKIADQIRENIGDLVPEDLLREKIAKVIDGVFFTRSGYNNQDYHPTRNMTDLLGELLNERVQEILAPVMASLDDKIEAVVKERVASGLLSSVISELDAVIAGSMQNQVMALKETMRSQGFNIY